MNNDRQKLSEFLGRLPEIRDAIRRIPELTGTLTMAFGKATLIWDPENQAETTTRIICGLMWLEIEALSDRLAEILDKARAVDAASRSWRASGLARRDIVFNNDLGDIAKIPQDLVRLLAGKQRIDCDVEREDDDIVFTRGEDLIARVPSTLFSDLDRIVQRAPWALGNPQATRSHSRSSHANQSEIPASSREDSHSEPRGR